MGKRSRADKISLTSGEIKASVGPNTVIPPSHNLLSHIWHASWARKNLKIPIFFETKYILLMVSQSVCRFLLVLGFKCHFNWSLVIKVRKLLIEQIEGPCTGLLVAHVQDVNGRGTKHSSVTLQGGGQRVV
jgi:hypothetical protein